MCENNTGLRVLIFDGSFTATVTNAMLRDAAKLPELARIHIRDSDKFEVQENGMVFDRVFTADRVPAWRHPASLYSSGRAATDAPTTESVLALVDKRLLEVVISGLTPTRFDADAFRAAIVTRGNFAPCAPSSDDRMHSLLNRDTHARGCMREAALTHKEPPRVPARTTYIDVSVAIDVAEVPQVRHTRLVGFLLWPPA